MVWSGLATILILCLMFITNKDFVSWMNFKTPPHAEYNVAILALGLAGGFTCFCWEVKIVCKKKINHYSTIQISTTINNLCSEISCKRMALFVGVAPNEYYPSASSSISKN